MNSLEPMSLPSCSVLIRTFNSERTLPETLASLRAHSVMPSEWVFVDSGSTDGTLGQIPNGATLHHYTGREFNYSSSLNQGLERVRSEFVLIISSHTTLENPDAVAYALELLRAEPAFGAAYFLAGECGELRHERITRATFDGFNGIWNTCALVRMSLWRTRPFRAEVFIAEDQEWSRWLLEEQGGTIARISGGGMRCANPRLDSPVKRLNEYVAVAWFANRQLLTWGNIGRQLWLALRLGTSGREYGRRFYLRLAIRLAACHVRPPKYQSRYY